MASIAHCLYCFESLSAHLERRKSLSLEAIQASWPEYAKTLDASDKETSSSSLGKLSKQLPALQRLAASSSSSGTSSPSSSSSVSLSADTPGTSTSSLPDADEEPELDPTDEFPLFVTWNTLSKRDPEDKALRGCIGTFEALELAEGLSSYAITSAVHDTRFEPVVASELPTLEVAVTLLTDFEDCEDPMDWTLGVHGLRISFFYHGRRYGATYLPDVATEQGWTKEETIVSLMRKAGWMGSRSRWGEVDLKCVRYQGKKESLEYAEYKRWRDWTKKKGNA